MVEPTQLPAILQLLFIAFGPEYTKVSWMTSECNTGIAVKPCWYTSFLVSWENWNTLHVTIEAVITLLRNKLSSSQVSYLCLFRNKLSSSQVSYPCLLETNVPVLRYHTYAFLETNLPIDRLLRGHSSGIFTRLLKLLN